MEDVDELRLTVSGAARRLGIAPATLRTWDRRYGVGPSDHARGRHRRYSAADMARLEVMQRALVKGASPAEAARYARGAVQEGRALAAPSGSPAPRTEPALAEPLRTEPLRTDDLPTEDPRTEPLRTAPLAPPAPRPDRGRRDGRADPAAGIDVIASLGAPGPTWNGSGGWLSLVGSGRGGGGLRMPGAGPAARGLARAAFALDSAAVGRLVEEAIERDGLAAAWDEVVRPALDALHGRARATGRGVEVARLLDECLVAVFHVRASTAPATLRQRPVLLAGMPGDEHGVPLAALSALLAERHIAGRSFGPALPAGALAAAVRRVAPAAVVLWSQVGATADPAVVAALPVTRPRFRTFVAGPGWAGVALPRGVIHLATLAVAADEVADAVGR